MRANVVRSIFDSFDIFDISIFDISDTFHSKTAGLESVTRVCEYFFR